MRIHIDSNIEEIIELFPIVKDYVQNQTVIGMYRALSLVKAEVLQNLRRNSGLSVRSGALFNSINTKIEMKNDLIIGEVYSQGVPYAETHEYGAIMPARVVYPSKAMALRWPGGGGFAFSKGHTIPSYSIPARPYMRPALESKAEEIYERFGFIIDRALGV